MLIESETLKAALIFNDKTGEITVPNMREVFRVIDSQPPFNPWRRVEEPPKEEGRYWCATKFAGHWIFYAAWYWYNVSDYTGVPVGKEEKADGFVLGEDVVYPDSWMPIEPPKEEA